MTTTYPDTTRIALKLRVVAISKNTNSFGLSGHVLVARDGRGWEAARCRYTPGYDMTKRGDDITFVETTDLATGRRDINWAAHGFEIPKELPSAPPKVLRELFKEGT